MTTGETQVFEQLREALAHVAEVGPEVAALSKRTAEEEREALESILAMVKPVMRYIDQPIETSYYHSGGQFAKAQGEYAKERGICLSAGGFGPESIITGTSDTRGDYGGWDYAFTRDGRILRLDYRGDWSRWQGEGSQWNADITESDVARLLKALDFAYIISNILSAFKDAAKKAETKQRTLQGRLDALQAVKKLLQ